MNPNPNPSPKPNPKPKPNPSPNPDPSHNLNPNQDEYSTLLRMQYVEIYNEQIKDLLEPSRLGLGFQPYP